MENKKWTSLDKLNQLRGVMGLVNSAKSNKVKTIATLRKKQSKEIKNLTTQNQKSRLQYTEELNGDKSNLLPVLHDHPQMEKAFKNLNPKQIEEELKQLVFCKHKELDRLRYKRQTLEQELLKKKLEVADLQKEEVEAPENYLWEQEIANKIQSTIVKQNAARTNRQVYEKARDILKNDAIRFDEILDSLRKDLAHQCECIVRAVKMGQDVTQKLDILQKEYKETEKYVLKNMIERDKATRAIRAQIETIHPHGHSSGLASPSPGHQVALLAEESEQDLLKVEDMHVKQETSIIERTLGEIKEAAAVHRVEDIIPRIEEQKIQYEQLTKHVKYNEEQLNKILDLHNQLDVMREVVMYHSMTDEAIQMREDRCRLRKDMDAENEDLSKARDEFIAMGQKIVDVRAALLSMNMMLDKVYVAGDSNIDVMDMSLASEAISGGVQSLNQPNTEALTLMEMVIRKVRWLIEQAAYVSALPTQQDSLYGMDYGVSKVGIEDEADNIVTDMLEDLEDMEDPSVLTRKGIKAESRRIVDLNTDPRYKFHKSSFPKFRKHKCF